MLFRGGHQPRITDLPILVVEYAANTYLIDGSSRVNLAVNDGRPHDVILLRVGDV